VYDDITDSTKSVMKAIFSKRN